MRARLRIGSHLFERENPRFVISASTALDLPTVNADVAQLVARNLAKVQVAGSNPVVRSD
jgi:hypothetical protein